MLDERDTPPTKMLPGLKLDLSALTEEMGPEKKIEWGVVWLCGTRTVAYPAEGSSVHCRYPNKIPVCK